MQYHRVFVVEGLGDFDPERDLLVSATSFATWRRNNQPTPHNSEVWCKVLRYSPHGLWMWPEADTTWERSQRAIQLWLERTLPAQKSVARFENSPHKGILRDLSDDLGQGSLYEEIVERVAALNGYIKGMAAQLNTTHLGLRLDDAPIPPRMEWDVLRGVFTEKALTLYNISRASRP